MYLEKAMENQMHIEVQVFADSEWNAVTMWLRNCSAQRRGQKLIEECGKLNIDENIIKQLESFVRETTKEIRYVWAGTFEFLYDPEKKKFTFMEMNTRIQVEHTITETQLKEAWVKAKRMKELNLVELQARLAMWENWILPKQKDIDKAFEKWYTTEIRLCAEDPMNNFTGVQMAKIKNLKIFKEPVKWIHSVHFESFLKEWKETGGNTWRWDSMIGQLIVSWKDRQTVSRYLKVALKKMNIEWIPVNKDFLVNVIESAEYKEGNFRINTIDKDMEWEKKFFKWLKKFNWDIESVIDADEDFIHLKNDEYIVRTSRDFTFYTKPSEDESAFITEWDEFKIDWEKPFYTQGVNKVFSDINSLEGTYIKNYQWKETPLKELWEIKITEVVVPENGTQVRIGNGLFIVKKA
jgi:acetyl/propionyl-CoA carboxylase alpha subunit